MDFWSDLSKKERDVLIKAFGGSITIAPVTFDYLCVVGPYILAEYYRENESYKKAFELYKTVVDEYKIGHSAPNQKIEEKITLAYYNSITYLGMFYYCGMGVEPDEKKGVALCKKSADENNDPEALNLLGCAYWEGAIGARDEDMAFYYYKKSADLGNTAAQNSLGRMYEFGKNRDLEKAFYWYKMAAEQGDELATENMMRLKGHKNISR